MVFIWIWSIKTYYLLYSCAKPILGKNLVPEILAKMLLTNQIVKFLNWLCLLNKIMTFCMSMQIQKLKVDWNILRWHGQKWVCPLWSQDAKSGSIARRNQWNKLIFGVQESSGKSKVTLIIFVFWQSKTVQAF